MNVDGWTKFPEVRSRGDEIRKNENGRREWKTSVICEVSSVVQASLCAISLGRDAVSSCECYLLVIYTSEEKEPVGGLAKSRTKSSN